ncbi:isopenicillin N synthase family oxygenase [Actibacterium sp. 188UL27-1]|uniref:isopenicillin N synthase family dioxygenase n=1 Tax=Actibacterium sp. 188UL27-1 TaxID=2786961 RepID=UPI00195C733B|nr:isopenicillin N synthase family oxygenase [Actibacterium sp. 188UL27-1]MBM7069468.1 isopenicillin N synthase family oxygenase [Actibacterium sp. 188UL27-1]
MIPVLDWTDHGRDPARFATGLGRACRDTGFFLLNGHGVEDDLIAAVFDQTDAFFAQPVEAKAKLDIRVGGANRGWVAFGSENLDDTSTGQTDQKEAFNIGFDLATDDPRIAAGEAFRAANVWPDLPGFRATMLAYYDALHQLGMALHHPIARDLGLEGDHFDGALDQPLAVLRLLHYPANPDAAGIGAGAHTDYGSLTLLMTDGEAGLQVKPRGADWTDVPHVPGAFVVNIGDCLMRWTNDIYISTPHRVLPPRRRRRSIAFFLDPNPDAVITALPGTGAALYPPITGADYLRSRLEATYTATAAP